MKNLKYTMTLSMVGILTLSACGGSGGGGTSQPDVVTLGEIVSQAEQIFAVVETAPQIATADIPSSGSATYAGLVSIGAPTVNDTSYLAAQLAMTVGFSGASSVTGTMSDIVYVPDFAADESTVLQAVDGALTLENGSINRAAGVDDPQFGANFSGTLNAPVEMFGIAAGTDVTVAGGFDGFFLEGAVGAEMDGTMTPAGGGAIDIDGAFFAIEQ